MRLIDRRSRRADILTAAEQEFGSSGYAGARMERIAALARVNKQLLFHYFDSKDGLFEAALARLLARFAVPGTQQTPTEEVRQILGAVQSAAHAVPGFVALLAGGEADREFPRAAAVRLRDWRAAILARLRAAIEEGQRRGYYRDDIDPESVAAVALAAALGLATIDAEPNLGEMLSDFCAWR